MPSEQLLSSTSNKYLEAKNRVSIPALPEPPVRILRATIPAAQSHLELPSETLFHGALDMSLHGICIYGKAAILSLWACLPKRTSLLYAYSYKEPFAA